MFDGRLRRISKDFSRKKCLESVLFGAHTNVRGLNVCINLVGSRKRGEEGERSGASTESRPTLRGKHGSCGDGEFNESKRFAEGGKSGECVAGGVNIKKVDSRYELLHAAQHPCSKFWIHIVSTQKGGWRFRRCIHHGRVEGGFR